MRQEISPVNIINVKVLTLFCFVFFSTFILKHLPPGFIEFYNTGVEKTESHVEKFRFIEFYNAIDDCTVQ